MNITLDTTSENVLIEKAEYIRFDRTALVVQDCRIFTYFVFWKGAHPYYNNIKQIIAGAAEALS